MEKAIIINVKPEGYEVYLKNGEAVSTFKSDKVKGTFEQMVKESERLGFKGKSRVYIHYWEDNAIVKRHLYGLSDVYASVAMVNDWRESR